MSSVLLNIYSAYIILGPSQANCPMKLGAAQRAQYPSTKEHAFNDMGITDSFQSHPRTAKENPHSQQT